jgi:hypothetical protein
MSSVGARIAARLPATLRSAAARIGAGIRSAAPRVAGVVRQAVTSRVGRVAIGATAIGAGVGLGSYLALSGFGAGQAYAQYATDQALAGEPPPGAPLLPWGQDFLAQPPPEQGLGLAPAQPFGYGGYGYGNRLAAFFTSPFVLFIMLLFVLAIIGIYVWKKTGK